MIKIVYSPHYDGEVFLCDAPQNFGTRYLGNNGLLQELGLRLGIPIMPKSEVERTADYLNAMKDVIKGTIFEKAADVDPFGVASKLMQWRDNLRMAGWEGYAIPDSQKLTVLAAIEKKFNSKGVADYWQMIDAATDSQDNIALISNSIGEIQIDCPYCELPGVIWSVIMGLEGAGVPVKWSVGQWNEDYEFKSVEFDLNSVKLVEFEDVNEAYEWIAQVEKFPKNTVIVNRDNVRLNNTFYTWNKPAVQSSLSQSNPQLLQLFKLSMSVFARPYNIQNLVSYLQLPLSPIPSELRYKLAHQLLKDGGFGETIIRDGNVARDEWNQIIETFEFTNKEGKVTPQAKAKKMPFLNVIRKPYTNGIPKQELSDYVGKLREWVRGFNGGVDMPEARIKQLHELSALLSSFATAIKSMPDVIQYNDIEKHILQIYTPMSYTLQQPELGSPSVITDIRAMVNPADTLIWLDCQAEEQMEDVFDFLNHSEMAYLIMNETFLPSFKKKLITQRKERIRLLNSVKERVILVSSKHDGITHLSEHSIVAEAKRVNKDLETKHIGKDLLVTDPSSLFPMKAAKKRRGKIDHYQPQLAYELGELDFQGRKEESSTAIEELIQRPFNYVMAHVAGLPMPDDQQIKDINLIKGLVAHHFFQHIIGESKEMSEKEGVRVYDRMRKLTVEQFENRLNAAIDATGLVLRQIENAAELYSFRLQLKDSMLALVDIMEHLGLNPVGCEMRFPADNSDELVLEGIGSFGARIDFLLTNSQGNYVIFDFKWSESKYYTEKLENNQAIQLELYYQAVCKTYPVNNVAGVGYYLMPKKQLVTADFPEIQGSSLVKRVNKADGDLFERIKNSYQYRMGEIRKGHIEEAEMMDLKEETNGYYMEQEDENLFPLDVDQKTEGKGENKKITAIIKKSEHVFQTSNKPAYEKKDKEANEQPTSHSILKGRLK